MGKTALVAAITQHSMRKAQEDNLRLELGSLKVSTLRKLASAQGVEESALDEAQDAANARTALVDVMIQHMMRKEAAPTEKPKTKPMGVQDNVKGALATEKPTATAKPATVQN